MTLAVFSLLAFACIRLIVGREIITVARVLIFSAQRQILVDLDRCRWLHNVLHLLAGGNWRWSFDILRRDSARRRLYHIAVPANC